MKTRPGNPTYNPPGTSINTVTAAIDPALGAASDLANVATLGVLFPPAMRIFVNSVTGALEVWKLQTSTAATGPGIQRPNDYNSITNTVVWFKAGS